MKHGLAACFALAILGACARAAPPIATLTRTEAAPAASTAQSERPQAERASSVAPAEPTSPRAASLALVRELDCGEAHLHLLPPKAFLSCGQELMLIEGDELRTDPSYQRGIEPEQPSFLWEIVAMAGQWPDAIWLARNRSTESAAQGRIHRWTGQRWERVADAMRDEPVSTVLPWTNQRAVALLQPPLGFGARLMPLGKPSFRAPRFTAPRLAHAHCRSRLRAEVQAALASGDLLFAGGQVCDVVSNHGDNDTTYAGLGVEHFTPDRAQSELLLLDELPAVPPHAVWQATALAAIGPDSALLAAQSVIDQTHTVGYLARWDGKSFHALPQPFPGLVQRIWAESPDVLWATDTQGRLWQGRGASFRRIAWEPPNPTDTEITELWARGPNDVWVLTHSKSHSKSAVFHGRVE